MSDLGRLRVGLSSAYERVHNWRVVAAEFHITSGMAWRIAVEGYEPRDAHIRYILGLPALVLVPVCRKCGEAHIPQRCTANRKPVVSWRDGEGWFERLQDWIRKEWVIEWT